MLVTNGRCEVSLMNAVCPLNSVTFGACRMLLRVSPWAA